MNKLLLISLAVFTLATSQVSAGRGDAKGNSSTSTAETERDRRRKLRERNKLLTPGMRGRGGTTGEMKPVKYVIQYRNKRRREKLPASKEEQPEILLEEVSSCLPNSTDSSVEQVPQTAEVHYTDMSHQEAGEPPYQEQYGTNLSSQDMTLEDEINGLLGELFTFQSYYNVCTQRWAAIDLLLGMENLQSELRDDKIFWSTDRINKAREYVAGKLSYNRERQAQYNGQPSARVPHDEQYQTRMVFYERFKEQTQQFIPLLMRYASQNLQIHKFLVEELNCTDVPEYIPDLSSARTSGPLAMSLESHSSLNSTQSQLTPELEEVLRSLTCSNGSLDGSTQSSSGSMHLEEKLLECQEEDVFEFTGAAQGINLKHVLYNNDIAEGSQAL